MEGYESYLCTYAMKAICWSYLEKLIWFPFGVIFRPDQKHLEVNRFFDIIVKRVGHEKLSKNDLFIFYGAEARPQRHISRFNFTKSFCVVLTGLDIFNLFVLLVKCSV